METNSGVTTDVLHQRTSIRRHTISRDDNYLYYAFTREASHDCSYYSLLDAADSASIFPYQPSIAFQCRTS